MTIFSLLSRNQSDRASKNTTSISSSLFPMSDRATVSDEITSDHLGRIYYQSTYWFGCSANDIDIPEGTIVELLELRGNTWLVRPAFEHSIV